MADDNVTDQGVTGKDVTGEDPDAEPEWKRKRRLAEIFGDVLPSTTGDERGPEDARQPSGENAGDEWLRAQVPPHHGKI